MTVLKHVVNYLSCYGSVELADKFVNCLGSLASTMLTFKQWWKSKSKLNKLVGLGTKQAPNIMYPLQINACWLRVKY